MKKILKKITGNWIFLFMVLFLYMIVGFFNFPILEVAFWEFYSVFLSVLPTLALVFVLMLLSHLLFKPKKVSVLLGDNSGFKGWLISIIGGILSSGPIYMWYPLLADLKEAGMKDGLIATFLYNRAVKIPMLPLLIAYFSLPFTILLSFYMVVFSVANGFLVEILLKNKHN